jgi:hypothetical protein
MNHLFDVLLIGPSVVHDHREEWYVMTVAATDPYLARARGRTLLRSQLQRWGMTTVGVRALYSGSIGQFDHMIGCEVNPELAAGHE